MSEFEDLYEYCVRLFGKVNVSKKDLKDPAGIEITVNTGVLPLSPVKSFELSLYRGDHPQFFMLPDEFRFEYNADEKRAIEEMKTYLKATKDGKVYIKSWNFMGLKFNSKLLIKD